MGYIGDVTRMGVRFMGVSVTKASKLVRAVQVSLTPLMSRGTVATDNRGFGF